MSLRIAKAPKKRTKVKELAAAYPTPQETAAANLEANAQALLRLLILGGGGMPYEILKIDWDRCILDENLERTGYRRCLNHLVNSGTVAIYDLSARIGYHRAGRELRVVLRSLSRQHQKDLEWHKLPVVA